MQTLVVLFLVVLLWSFLGGMNGHWFQTTDWDCRNAVFRDLITHKWPVRYANGSAMVYYIGHWLPAAAISKICFQIGGLDLAWAVGQNLLWLWTAVGIYFVLLLLLVYCKAEKNWQIVLMATLFVFFSGMDIVGAVITKHLGALLAPDVLHLEWWISYYQFSSLTTCIYWVFNQTVVPWLTVLCFLHEKTPRNYVFLGVACLACGPFPMVGLAVLMVVRVVEYVVNGVKKREKRGYFSQIFLPGNLLGILTVVPVYLVYYICNNATIGTVEQNAAIQNAGLATRITQWIAENFKVSVLYFLAFFILEAGIQLVLVHRDQKHQVLYYAVWVSLFVFPHFQVGESIDFCMRASIPGVFLLMVFCGEALLKHLPELKQPCSLAKAQTLLLIGCLLLGSITPCVEIGRGFYHVMRQGTTELAYDPIYSFETQPVMYNFSTEFPEQTIFFRYLAR